MTSGFRIARVNWSGLLYIFPVNKKLIRLQRTTKKLWQWPERRACGNKTSSARTHYRKQSAQCFYKSLLRVNNACFTVYQWRCSNLFSYRCEYRRIKIHFRSLLLHENATLKYYISSTTHVFPVPVACGLQQQTWNGEVRTRQNVLLSTPNSSIVLCGCFCDVVVSDISVSSYGFTD